MTKRLLCLACGMYARLTPIEKGRWRAQRLAVDLADALRGDRRRRVVCTRDGVNILVDGTSQAGRILLCTGEYESPTARVIQTLLRPGDAFVDVGAHIGFFTLLAAPVVGASGRVLAFEPLPGTRALLFENVRRNQFHHVTIHAEALTDSTGMASMSAPPNDSGLATLRANSDSTLRVPVQTARFDDLVTPDFRVAGVKMDVEGAEQRVLAGMEGTLRRHRPWLVIEITNPFLQIMGDSATSLIETLAALDYQGWLIGSDRLVALSDLEDLPSQFNALFTPAQRHS
jgi:FkbM family methyltransferase